MEAWLACWSSLTIVPDDRYGGVAEADIPAFGRAPLDRRQAGSRYLDYMAEDSAPKRG
jgi:hypothetical protein